MRIGIVLVVCGMFLAGFDNSAPAEEKDAGAKPLFSLSGRNSKITEGGYHRVESTRAWDALWARHQTDAFQKGEIDFERCMAVAVFAGAAVNCYGFKVHSILEDKDRVLVRVQRRCYQTVSQADVTEPWGVFVLPRSTKLVAVEIDTNSVIADPPKWVKVAELKPGDSSVKK